MARILLVLIFAMLQASFFAPLQAQTWEWAKRAGSTFEEQSRGVATDAAGNTYIAGFFVGQTNFGTGLVQAYGGAGADIFIAKYNPSGVLQWMQRAGSDQDDFAYDIAVNSIGEVFVSGRFQDTASFGNITLMSAGAYDVFVAKYSTNGTAQWAQRYGGLSSDLGYSIALDPTGNIFISGSFQNSTTIGSNTFTTTGGTDAFVAKLNSTGAVQWAKQAGGVLNDLAYRVASDPSGNCLVTGSFWSTATFGSLSVISSGNADVFVAKYDAAGNEQWVKKGGGLQEDNSYGLATDNLGNIFVSGYFRNTATFDTTSLSNSGNYEIFLVKYSPSGTVEWGRSAGGTGYDNAWDIGTDDNGNCYLAGYFQNTATFGNYSVSVATDRDLFVAKYNPSGTAQWVRSAGGAMFDNAYSIATTASGNSFITGFISATATFGSINISSGGSYDAMVAKIKNCHEVANAGPDVSVCSGQAVSLGAGSAQTGVNYSWSVSPSIGGFSSTQNQTSVTLPAVSGPLQYTFTLTASSAGGCTVTDQVLVNVNPVPVVLVSNTTGPVCAGGAAQLTASGAASYSWQSSASLSGTAGSAVTATPNATTTYTVYGANPGCPAVAQTVTVNVIAAPSAPVATAGPACMGQNLALTASASANNTYSWFGPDGFTSNSQFPVVSNVSAANAGVYSVFASGTAPGCVSAPGTVSVSVSPVPAATTAFNNGPVCAGLPLTLNAAPVANAQYTWSGPANYFATGQSAVVQNTTTAMSGNYSVTVTVNGCTSVAATTFATINHTPVFSILSSNTPICLGADIILSADAGAGVTYSWAGPASFSSTDQNPVIASADSAMTGTYSVFAASGTCVSNAGTVYVAVQSFPTMPEPLVNNPVCEGDTIKLGVAYVAGASYSWVGPGNYASLQANPEILNASFANAGLYTVYSVGAGCTPLSDTISVQIKPAPATPIASSNSPLCEGFDINLFAGGGVNYTWAGPGNFSAIAQNVTIPNATATASGIYSVTATADGCTSQPGLAIVNVMAAPVVTITATADTIGAGGSTQLLASTAGNGPYSYSWIPATGLSSTTVANPVATPGGSVTYSVLVTDSATGCSSMAAISIIVSAAPNNLADNSLRLQAFPNPFNGQFTAVISSDKEQSLEVVLTDLLGRVIQTKHIKAITGDNTLEYNLNGICADGMYLLMVKAGDTMLYERVVKAR